MGEFLYNSVHKSLPIATITKSHGIELPVDN
jgi:hypothetical protein